MSRQILNRAKGSERENARYLQQVDEPDQGTLGKLATSTGRVGHLKTLQFDTVSKHYVGENKYVTRVAKNPTYRISKEVIYKLLNISKKYAKEVLFIIHIADCPVLHAISKERHAWLLSCERMIEQNGLEAQVREDYYLRTSKRGSLDE